jgi:CTP synthase
MPLTLVMHANPQPALHGAMAAVAARSEGARLLHLRAFFHPTLGADAVQHVAAEGALVPSGLLWFERLTGQRVGVPVSVQYIVAAARRGAVVVPWHSPVHDAGEFGELLALARAQGVSVKQWRVEEREACWALRGADGEEGPGGWWRRDVAGRLTPVGTEAPARAHVTLRIALIGAAHDQREVYPANLAALGDAADALGFALDVRCIPPRAFADGALRDVDGVLLPGGSDMCNVPGQLAVAQLTLREKIPTLGLCLGMQTMATALVRLLPEGAQANLAEADPDAPIKSFVPLAMTPGLPLHRLGDQPVRFDDPQLAALLGTQAQVRCNHRYHLNPVLVPRLREHGVRIAATDPGGRIVDAVAAGAATHPFYIGMQGHPELSSRREAAHPLVTAFLTAAAGQARRGA